ncbi:cystathionine beta-lyase [Bhargavaea cecembensis]|uniref:cysteine-S-conjugate beta-lyase n=1 Tax=Bhargavaea cecembensis TaxID=394098 RepID=A0A161SLR5_9BACL|nr:MalY/PatB family protein [Bhargavaea cecembensis]KZE38663.1 cystathionine beta-lyase [Bhargavaea cecembensis]
MTYNFDETVERRGTASAKWDAVKDLFGSDDVLPLWVADMDFRVPDEVVKAIKKTADHGIFGYTLRSEEYKNAVSGWMKKRHGWEIDGEWITQTPGIVNALNMAVLSYTEQGDSVIVQPPVYYPFMKAAENHGRKVVHNPLIDRDGRYEMDFDDLETKIEESGAKLLFLCNPQNPSGRVWTPEELQRLGDICLRHGLTVISDEIHGDLILGDQPHTPFASISDKLAAISVTCTAPSKTFNLAGLHTSNIIIPNEQLRKTFNTEMQKYAIGGSSPIGAAATIAAYRQGEEWLEGLLDYIRDNYNYLKDYTETNISELRVYPLESTYLAWVDARALGLSNKELETFMAKEAKVGLNQGHIFGPGGEGFVRVNLACTRQTLEEALKRIDEAVKKHQGTTA